MSSILTYLQIIGITLAILLPLANPLTSVVLMLSLGSRMSVQERNHQSFMAGIYAFSIMMIAFYFGQFVMLSFGISIPGLRISGGLIVTFIGFRMLFPEDQVAQSPEFESKKTELKSHATTNIAFIPLAMPGTAGPGTIAMVISIAATLPNTIQAPMWMIMTAPTFSFLIVSLILWIALRSATLIIKYLGQSGVDAISRLMGFLLICMGIQFGINGILEIIASIQAPAMLSA